MARVCSGVPHLDNKHMYSERPFIFTLLLLTTVVFSLDML